MSQYFNKSDTSPDPSHSVWQNQTHVKKNKIDKKQLIYE